MTLPGAARTVQLARVGRLDEALTAAVRSVEIFERLMAGDPDRYGSVAAQSLANLVILQGQGGVF